MHPSPENSSNRSKPLRIFVDGGCKLCAWELRNYLRYDPHHRLEPIDIDAPGFEAEKFGLDRQAVRKYFHVMTPDGKIIAGLDAFIRIWETLDIPFTRVTAGLAKMPPIKLLLRIAYRGFVEVRPYLPRNKAVGCTDDSCKLH